MRFFFVLLMIWRLNVVFSRVFFFVFGEGLIWFVEEKDFNNVNWGVFIIGYRGYGY